MERRVPRALSLRAVRRFQGGCTARGGEVAWRAGRRGDQRHFSLSGTRPVDPLLEETVSLAWGAIRDMTAWMREVVRAFPEERFRPTRQREDASYLGWRLYRGRCDCGMKNCAAWHDLGRQAASGIPRRWFV